ncbi:MAG: excinuclease ABC subunit C [Candidatus Woykebacteria bacterium RBG_13_40_15]|uniref:Excinuclease ABC subunit C n=1 Tax=Candidatus Woykebacteria bacterium RBG_13_40_15 TaxID=1802593 RepID=A0A1G1W9H2_9BACT|nr:MAG: excinuclease ABC subunit C [Candidatus Woykebacteria bacterium RBG_13_40_15]
MYFTYVLLSSKDGKFYIGFTKDLKARIKDHNNGSVNSTRKRRPLKLVYYECCLNETDAVKREKYFKTGFGRRYLKNRITNFLNDVVGS